MIKYKLTCKDCNILFDSWFASSAEYEKLKKKNYINCYLCSSLNVEKTLMSPNVFISKSNPKKNIDNKKYKKTKKMIIEYKNFIKKNFEDVGKNFPHEARSIYYKNKKNIKGIYGTATSEELGELREEGIEIELIPWIKNEN